METQLRHTAGGIHLTVSDKGQGVHGPVPASRPAAPASSAPTSPRKSPARVGGESTFG